MNKEQKRKLRNISLLALVGLIGGTFAFQAFNQQAINDRLRDNEVEVGGRVHDYYNRDTENKDVFVENYGQTPIMARIRLSEFMEIQRRGQDGFEPVVPNTERGDVGTWTTWMPEADNINLRQDDNDNKSASFNEFSNLTLGWERNGQSAPWYLPTFNHVMNDDRTAAAGHARDWLAGEGATDGVTDGATHPGDGTDADWSEGASYNNAAGDWFGSQVTRETAQNLPQEKEPMTIQEWNTLPIYEKIGDFWVVDHETGWAYWASALQAGETTSYLLDAAEMTPEAEAINGSYYYGINVESGLVSLDQSDAFLNDGDEHHEDLEELLIGIQNNAVDDVDGNPMHNVDAAPSRFTFENMNPGRIFTMAGEQYRYLEDMGEGNHMIIRNEVTTEMITLNEFSSFPAEWYEELDESVKDIVQPVAATFTGVVPHDVGITWEQRDNRNWIPTNLHIAPEAVAEDITKVVPHGVKRAFFLSLADMTRLSQNGIFSSLADRQVPSANPWWLRTTGAQIPMGPPTGFYVNSEGGLDRGLPGGRFPRPALIVNNQTN